jgi:hypothetical protein
VGSFLQHHRLRQSLIYKPALWNQARQEVRWFSAMPQDLFIFNGVCEFLGSVGLLPAA